jgi:hypothetical protein
MKNLLYLRIRVIVFVLRFISKIIGSATAIAFAKFLIKAKLYDIKVRDKMYKERYDNRFNHRLNEFRKKFDELEPIDIKVLSDEPMLHPSLTRNDYWLDLCDIHDWCNKNGCSDLKRSLQSNFITDAKKYGIPNAYYIWVEKTRYVNKEGYFS